MGWNFDIPCTATPAVEPQVKSVKGGSGDRTFPRTMRVSVDRVGECFDRGAINDE